MLVATILNAKDDFPQKIIICEYIGKNTFFVFVFCLVD